MSLQNQNLLKLAAQVAAGRSEEEMGRLNLLWREGAAAAAAGRPNSHGAGKTGNKQQRQRMEWGGEELAYLDRSSRRHEVGAAGAHLTSIGERKM